MTGEARLLDGCHVLLAGESWMTQAYHSKGVVSYTTGSYEEGGEPLIEALKQGGASVTYLPNHRAAEEFPRHAEGLGRYTTVILSDIASDTLLLDRACFVEGVRSVNRLGLLTRYVEGGGSLLMVGGYMSFSGFQGKAHYGVTPLADILPVLVSETDDRVETPEGVTPTVRDGRHPVLDGIEGEWPYFLGYNRLVAKAGVEVPLSFEDDPLLVLARQGAGRVAAFASDCSPHWGSRDFLSWPHYARFWTQLVAWLADPKGGA
jgi:uncharacterized membrane protein